MNTVLLTIGHNVSDEPTHTTAAVCEAVARVLQVEAFTAIPCYGMWRGAAEEGTRIEVCGLTDKQAAAIVANVPALADALQQVEIMAEVRAARVEFIKANKEEQAA